MTATTSAPTKQGPPVAKSKPTKPTDTKAPEPKTFALRFADSDVEARIVSAADGLGLDPTNFLRMIVRENLATYEKRVERIKQGNTAE